MISGVRDVDSSVPALAPTSRLVGLPESIWLRGIAPFLNLKECAQLVRSCSRLYDLTRVVSGRESIWTVLFRRDFPKLSRAVGALMTPSQDGMDAPLVRSHLYHARRSGAFSLNRLEVFQPKSLARKDVITAVAGFSDSRVAIGLQSGHVHIISADRQSHRILNGISEPVHKLAVMPDGALLVDHIGQFCIWSADLSTQTQFEGMSPIVLRDGRFAYATGHIIHVRSPEDERLYTLPDDWVDLYKADHLTEMTDGRLACSYISSHVTTKFLRIWSLDDGQSRRIETGERARLLVALPGERLFLLNGRDHRFYYPPNPTQSWEKMEYPVSRFGDHLVTQMMDVVVRGKVVHSLKGGGPTELGETVQVVGPISGGGMVSAGGGVGVWDVSPVELIELARQQATTPSVLLSRRVKPAAVVAKSRDSVAALVATFFSSLFASLLMK